MSKDVSDKAHKELTPDWVYHIFEDNYITAKTIFTVDECHFKQENGMVADAVIHHNGNDRRIVGVGNGRLDAVSNAIKHYFDVDYQLAFYEEHSLTKGSSSRAVAYVGIIYNKKKYWGVGIDADIIKASDRSAWSWQSIRSSELRGSAGMQGCKTAWRSRIISMQTISM